jgi:tRNA/rRNA methyltransferase
VLLMSYEWMKSGMEDLGAVPFQAMGQTPSTKEQLFGLFDQLEEALDARGYFHPAGKKPKMIDNLRAVLSRRAFTEQEISVLRGVISSLDRFSRKSPRGGRFPTATKETPPDDSADA